MLKVIENDHKEMKARTAQRGEQFLNKKSARFARTFSSRASLARMSAPGARDLMVLALRAPIYVIVALRAQCCVLHSA